MRKIPIKLEDCPIIESVLEIRFDSTFDRSVVFPMLYSVISGDFQAPMPLPALQIPENVRSTNPDLIFQPDYRLELKADPNVSIQIGPRVIAFSFTQRYQGWDSFKNYVTKYVGLFKSAGVIGKVLRLGFRVINFFDWDIYRNGLELNISLLGKEIPYLETALKTKFQDGLYESTVNIVNSATLNNVNGNRVGSIIDIDTYSVHCDNFFAMTSDYMDQAHSVEKNIFFNLLTEELINKLKPTYND